MLQARFESKVKTNGSPYKISDDTPSAPPNVHQIRRPAAYKMAAQSTRDNINDNNSSFDDVFAPVQANNSAIQ